MYFTKGLLCHGPWPLGHDKWGASLPTGRGANRKRSGPLNTSVEATMLLKKKKAQGPFGTSFEASS